MMTDFTGTGIFVAKRIVYIVVSEAFHFNYRFYENEFAHTEKRQNMRERVKK